MATTSVRPMTNSTEVSFTMPISMLPMLGIAILVACGRITETNIRDLLHARAPARLALAVRNRLERGSVYLGDERRVEQRERDHAGNEHPEVDARRLGQAEVTHNAVTITGTPRKTLM